jgi:hypothetical protein
VAEINEPSSESHDRSKKQGEGEEKKRVSGSTEFRAGAAAITAAVMGVVLVAALQKGIGISDSATTVTILLVPLLVYGMVSGRLTELTGPGGWGAKFAKLEAEIEKTKGEMERQQEQINKLVTLSMSPSVLHHLAGITLLKHYEYREGKEDGKDLGDLFKREFYLLKDRGFIGPHTVEFLPEIKGHNIAGMGFDLRLMPSLNDEGGIPREGKDLIVVAAVNNVLHFRNFGHDGKALVDTDEKRLAERARQVDDLREQLEGLWPPHELTWGEKARVLTAVTSIVGHHVAIPTELGLTYLELRKKDIITDEVCMTWFDPNDRDKRANLSIEAVRALGLRVAGDGTISAS